MKVCFYNVTATMKTGGLETYCHMVAKELQKLGVDVEIVGGKRNENAQRALASEYEKEKFLTFRSPRELQSVYDSNTVKIKTFSFRPRESFPDLGSRFRKLAERMTFFLNAKDYLLKQDYDWIVIVKPYDFPSVWYLKKKGKKTKVFFRSGGRDFYSGDRIFSTAVDVYASSSQFNAAQVKERYRVNVEIIPNGVDTDTFSPEEQDYKLARDLRISPEDKVIVSAGRIVGWKGLQYILAAIPSIRRMLSGRIKYLVIGEGGYKKEMDMVVDSLKIRDDVIFTGEVRHADLPRYLSLADIFIQPSIGDEAFGISMIEAMSCGIPVIGSNIGGIPEIVVDGYTGYLISPRDSDAIAEAVVKLLMDDKLRKDMGERARERVIENFTWKRNAERHLEIFQEKIQKR